MQEVRGSTPLVSTTIKNMVTITAIYQGELHCEAVHTPSKTTLQTDAPKDNQGKGESFSPTDLVATALGTCMLTTMGIAARKYGFSVDGSTITVEKVMTATPTRRIGSLQTTIMVPHKLDDEQKKKMESAALGCPVHQSLHPDIALPVTFVWAK
jgi:putative redox protein